MKIDPRIAAVQSQLTAWRRDIHAHPELGFEELRTSELVASKLKEFGCEVTTGIAKTGVVGTIRVGNSPRAIGLRADMDCLPMQELNDFAHKSIHKGRMHACGHDGHTTMLLGAAQYLAATRNFEGAVHFFFQPAEEGGGGGRVIVEEGLFEKFPCEAVFGMHNRPSLPAGKFAVRPGPMMAAAGRFDINITGKGAHGARPESGVDPVLVGGHIITALQSIVSRNVSPHYPAVISVTQMHAGDAYNVIPESAVLRGTFRAFLPEVIDMIMANIRRVSEGVASALGAKVDFWLEETYPPLVNNADEAAFAASVAEEIVGKENVNRNGPLVMGSEDFSFMLNACPGAFMLIGNGGLEGEGEIACEVHNPKYDFNDNILPLGATFLARLVETRLAPKPA